MAAERVGVGACAATSCIELSRPDFQGRQYTALAFGRHLEHNGVLCSMGRVGSAHDNAMAESFFASLQAELLDRKIWSRRSELKAAIFEYIEIYYNRVCRHSRLGHLAHHWNMNSKPKLSTSQELITCQLSIKAGERHHFVIIGQYQPELVP